MEELLRCSGDFSGRALAAFHRRHQEEESTSDSDDDDDNHERKNETTKCSTTICSTGVLVAANRVRARREAREQQWIQYYACVKEQLKRDTRESVIGPRAAARRAQVYEQRQAKREKLRARKECLESRKWYELQEGREPVIGGAEKAKARVRRAQKVRGGSRARTLREDGAASLQREQALEAVASASRQAIGFDSLPMQDNIYDLQCLRAAELWPLEAWSMFPTDRFIEVTSISQWPRGRRVFDQGVF